MEVYGNIRTELLEPDAEVFKFFWIDDGVGISGGLKEPIPIHFYITLDNEYMGLDDLVLIDIDAEFKFKCLIEFDDDFIYPEFVYEETKRSKVVVNH